MFRENIRNSFTDLLETLSVTNFKVCQNIVSTVGRSQYHLAVAGGCGVIADFRLPIFDLFLNAKPIENQKLAISNGYAPTRYREVVLTATHAENLFRTILGNRRFRIKGVNLALS